MWEKYGASGNGICIEFDVIDYDYLYPVEYLEKVKIDFDEMIIPGINNGDASLAMIPWVIKNPYNETSDFDSTMEKEVRIFCCPYDYGELNRGKIEKNIKERLDYKGIEKPYADFGLEISRIILGNRCNKELRYELEKHMEMNGITGNQRRLFKRGKNVIKLI